VERLHRVLERNRWRILEHENIAGVGIGPHRADECCSEQASVVVFVKQQVSLAELSRSGFIPPEIPPAALKLVEVGEFVAYGVPAEDVLLQDRDRKKRNTFRTFLDRVLPFRR